MRIWHLLEYISDNLMKVFTCDMVMWTFDWSCNILNTIFVCYRKGLCQYKFHQYYPNSMMEKDILMAKYSEILIWIEDLSSIEMTLAISVTIWSFLLLVKLIYFGHHKLDRVWLDLQQLQTMVPLKHSDGGKWPNQRPTNFLCWHVSQSCINV